MTPSIRFPLPAGGTEWARGLVPLAKRGEPKGGGYDYPACAERLWISVSTAFVASACPQLAAHK